MAAIVKQEARVVKAGNVEVGEVDHSQVTIKTTGQRVNIPGNMYGDTNFYIVQRKTKQDRPFLKQLVYLCKVHYNYVKC